MFSMHVTCDMHTTLYSQYCDMHVSLNMHESCMQHAHYMQEGQKLFKKESDVGMLLTGKQGTETSCM